MGNDIYSATQILCWGQSTCYQPIWEQKKGLWLWQFLILSHVVCHVEDNQYSIWVVWIEMFCLVTLTNRCTECLFAHNNKCCIITLHYTKSITLLGAMSPSGSCSSSHSPLLPTAKEKCLVTMHDSRFTFTHKTAYLRMCCCCEHVVKSAPGTLKIIYESHTSCDRW